MKNPHDYLLECIINNKTNGLTSLGKLSGNHVSDISKIMENFATETVQDTIDRLIKGESISINNKTYSLKK